MRFRAPRLVRRLWVRAAVQVWPLTQLWYRSWGLRLDGQPSDSVWYFAYGANMHASAFRERRGMRPAEWRTGRVPGYRLRFNLDGRPKGKAAPANISTDPEAEVWGVLYRITLRELVRLNVTEGVPGPRYQPVELPAHDQQGNRLTAIGYMADGNDEDGRPSLRYITLLRDGARDHGLPEQWIDHLHNVQPAE
ncbi:MAG: gamma-glutamylcyclotransferase [Alphaproteobacteria bacterium]|nr:gamma-glutamylcyclotransferase [Alphaproteobacteria bacterium]